MGKTVESCGGASAENSIIANGGIGKDANIGYFKSLLWVSDTVALTPNELKDIETVNALVVTGDAVFLGDGKFEDTSTAAAYFEDAELSIKRITTEKIKSLNFILEACACTVAELEKLESKGGRLFVQTSTGLAIGRDLDGKGKGMAYSSITVDTSVPTSATPAEYTTINITFSDSKGDMKNPYRIAVDYLFNEIDQVYSAVGTSTNAATDNTTLTADLSINKDCTTEALAGVVAGDLKAEDKNGVALTIASYAAGVISITTAETVAYVSFDGIKEKEDLLYYMDKVTVRV